MGSILAQTSITLDNGATINCGRAVALTGAVTMDTNTVSTDDCTGTVGTVNGAPVSYRGGDTPISSTPEPGTLSLLALGFSGIAFLRIKRRRVGNRKMA